MKNTTDRFDADILNQVQNSVQETLLLHAPDAWADDDCDQIKRQVLDGALSLLTLGRHHAAEASQTLINSAVDETKRLIEEWKDSRGKWLFPNDPDLTTFQVTVHCELIKEMEAAVTQFGLKDREEFVTLAVNFAISHLRENSAIYLDCGGWFPD